MTGATGDKAEGTREGTHPPPSAAQPGMVDFDKYRRFGAYHWKLVDRLPDYRRRVETVCEFVRPGDRCLDLGCGDGTYIGYVAERGGLVTGVDGDADGIRCAQEELERRNVPGFRLVHSTFADLPRRLVGEERSFDFVYSMDCIEHLVNPHELLDVVERYLAPRGTVLIGTPLFVGAEFVSQYHVKEFTRDEITELLTARFERMDERLLDAPVPGREGVVPRFFVFHGRRRAPWWKFWRRGARR